MGVTAYPNDSDGDALRRVVDGGADMTRPMEIDFSIDAPGEAVALHVVELVAGHGFSSRIYHDEETESWSVYCSRTMLATYEGVVAVQQQLNDLISALGAECDGWGTFGNTQSGLDNTV